MSDTSEMSRAIIPEELAERVAGLVRQHDGGDVAAAAQRIGVRERDLRAIVEASDEPPTVTMLSAIVRGYDVDAWWLIAGEEATSEAIGALPVERRVDSLNLLSEVGATLTRERRLSTLRARQPRGDERASA